MKHTLDPAMARFVDRLGLAAEAEGMPRIAGRVMAFLMADGEAHTAADLAEALSVSRGSISTNVRLLERLGIIERSTRSGARQDYYRICEDPYGRLVEGQLERMRKLERIVSESMAEFATSGIGGGKRLANMQRFYRYAIRHTEGFVKGWREEGRRK